MTESQTLDLDFVRSNFPAFDDASPRFFENAGGSFACRQTIDALTGYYTNTKVQPYASYGPSADAGDAMDRSHERWADALGVATDEVAFGPSTSQNTYVLAEAYAQTLRPGDEVIVTNQDHEANTGVIRRATERAGATLREWRIDPETGLLALDQLEALLSASTKVVAVPHCSNIVGQENDVAAFAGLAHDAGARVICDGVSFAPHGIPDVAALDVDVYLFSLYKVYSVHQGLMVARRGILDELPNQGHFFNAGYPDKRLTPAGPDHAQVACADAVLDYVDATAAHHGLAGAAAQSVSTLWQAHEDALLAPMLETLAGDNRLRLIGPDTTDAALHRCPTVAFSPIETESEVIAQRLVDAGIWTSHGTYYADRVLEGVGIDPARGVVRLSFVHYTSADDVAAALTALDASL